MKTTKTKYLGCCQICEGEFKIVGGFTSTHGYKRPGHGYIVGRCGGAKQLPYETSCELIKSYLVGLKTMLVQEEQRLAEMEAGVVTYFQKTELSWRTREMETTQYAIGVTDFYKWGDVVKANIWNKKNLVKMITSDIVRLTRRIETWELKAVREVV